MRAKIVRAIVQRQGYAAQELTTKAQRHEGKIETMNDERGMMNERQAAFHLIVRRSVFIISSLCLCAFVV
jgi:hypothetical protein